MIHEQAGRLSREVVNVHLLAREFEHPSEPLARVKFGTSGHRGRLGGGFCRLHALAIAQVVARLHQEQGIKGPVLVGGDTRLMSEETSRLCAEVLTGNGLEVVLADIPLPTPVFSSEILNGGASASLNGTASHNPPDDMGLKYNPSHGGPAGTETTSLIETYANECLDDPKRVQRITLAKAKAAGLLHSRDLVTPYLQRLAKKVDIEAIRSSGLRIAIHPLGGASIPFYAALGKGFDGIRGLKIVDRTADPTFGFIPLDHDGKIRMDPSSRYPMSPLLEVLETGSFDLAGASDPDADRFGVATKAAGLVAPNQALSIALDYLLSHRPEWPETLQAGRTIGTTHLIDRIAKGHGREVHEVNVGFKYYVEGQRAGRYALCGEESAGLSIHGWTTEKDGILAVLLLAEVMAKTGKDLVDAYRGLTSRYGEPAYRRVDIQVDEPVRLRLRGLKAQSVSGVASVAGEKVTGVRDTDGLKVYLEDSWFLARPSGTEPIAKLYGESFRGEEHLKKVLREGGALLGLTVQA